MITIQALGKSILLILIGTGVILGICAAGWDPWGMQAKAEGIHVENVNQKALNDIRLPVAEEQAKNDAARIQLLGRLEREKMATEAALEIQKAADAQAVQTQISQAKAMAATIVMVGGAATAALLLFVGALILLSGVVHWMFRHAALPPPPSPPVPAARVAPTPDWKAALRQAREHERQARRNMLLIRDNRGSRRPFTGYHDLPRGED